MYFPDSRFSGRWAGRSISSVTIVGTSCPYANASRNTSFASASSFCCFSPWMLTPPEAPRTSVRPADDRIRLMRLPANASWERRSESSPVAAG